MNLDFLINVAVWVEMVIKELLLTKDIKSSEIVLCIFCVSFDDLLFAAISSSVFLSYKRADKGQHHCRLYKIKDTLLIFQNG